MSRELELDKRENITSINVNGDEKEVILAEEPADEKLSVSRKVIKELLVEEAATCEPEESHSLTTSHDLDVEINKQPSHNDGPSGRDTLSPAPAEEEESPAAAAHKESMQLLQELNKESEDTRQLNRQLQMKLAGYFHRRANHDVQLERPGPEQLQEYKKHLDVLTHLKLQFRSSSESAQQQVEELEVQAQEKLDQVEKEWRALVALKQDATVTALGRRLGKEAARARVQSVLVAEQLQQDELIKVRLKHFKLKLKIHRLEAELRQGDEDCRDPLQIQFEQLQAERLEQKKQADKQNEESLKLQKKTSSCVELLSNIKQKLFWSEMEVQSKRQQLAELEAAVVRKKDHLTQTKLARTSLQRNNLGLRERCGLLGNRILLQDFEDTLDASDHLETHLETLKFQQADAVSRCGRGRKKLETTSINQ